MKKLKEKLQADINNFIKEKERTYLPYFNYNIASEFINYKKNKINSLDYAIEKMFKKNDYLIIRPLYLGVNCIIIISEDKIKININNSWRTEKSVSVLDKVLNYKLKNIQDNIDWGKYNELCLMGSLTINSFNKEHLKSLLCEKHYLAVHNLYIDSIEMDIKKKINTIKKSNNYINRQFDIVSNKNINYNKNDVIYKIDDYDISNYNFCSELGRMKSVIENLKKNIYITDAVYLKTKDNKKFFIKNRESSNIYLQNECITLSKDNKNVNKLIHRYMDISKTLGWQGLILEPKYKEADQLSFEIINNIFTPGYLNYYDSNIGLKTQTVNSDDLDYVIKINNIVYTINKMRISDEEDGKKYLSILKKYYQLIEKYEPTT